MKSEISCDLFKHPCAESSLSFHANHRHVWMMDVEELSGSFLLSVVVLLLVFSCKHVQGGFQVVGAPQPVVAAAGSDVILSCHVEPPLSVAGLTVEWSKPDFKPRWEEYVHLYRDTREDVDMKIPAYKHRTALFKDELTRGNISLKIMNVTFEDSGIYRCFIPKLKTQKRLQFAMVWLVVETNSADTWTSETPLQHTITEEEETDLQAGDVSVRNRVIAGVVVGILVAIILVVGVAIYLRRKSQQREVVKVPVI